MQNENEDRHPVRWRRLIIFAGLVFLGVLYPLLIIRVLRDPLQRTAVDFLPFYAAGRISITQGMSMVYDWETQRQAENDVVVETVVAYLVATGRANPSVNLGTLVSTSEVNPFPHPPYIVPVLGLLAHLDYVHAYITWIVLMVIVSTFASYMLARLIPQATGKTFWILWVSIFLFFPGYFGILNGQDSSLLLLAAAVWFWGLLNMRDRVAGLGLGFVTIRPHMALVLAPLFLIRRKKIGLWCFAMAGILILFSLFLLNRQGIANYLQILIISGNGEGNKFFNEELMINLIGILRRAFPNGSSIAIRWIGWAGYLAAIVYLGFVWIKSHRIEERHIGLAVVLTILGVPHFHYHDLVLLLIPMIGCLRVLLVRKSINMETAILILLGFSTALFTTYFLFLVLKYFVVYLGMACMLIILWFPTMPFSGRWSKQEIK